MQIYGPSAVVTSVKIETYGTKGAVALEFPAHITLMLTDVADADELIRAVVAAKDIMVSGHAEPQLYVVVEVYDAETEPARQTTVTGPKPRAEAEAWARGNAWSFAGRLEVVPATQADLDDTDGDAA